MKEKDGVGDRKSLGDIEGSKSWKEKEKKNR